MSNISFHFISFEVGHPTFHLISIHELFQRNDIPAFRRTKSLIRLKIRRTKSLIRLKINVPAHHKLVDSLVLFDKPKKDGVNPVTTSKTFKETFESHDLATQLELYTDYHNPHGSDRTAKRKHED